MVWLAYAAMCLIWGTTWLVIKSGLHYVPPVAGVGIRFLLAGVLMYAVAIARGEAWSLKKLPWRVVLMFAAFYFAINYLLIYTAELRLDSGLVAVLFGTMPFFMFAFSKFFGGEGASPRVWSGAAVALAGVAVMSIGGAVSASPLYALAALGAAASGAIANLYAKQHANYPPLVTLPPAMTVAGLTLSIAGLLTEHVAWSSLVATQSLAAIAYLAIFGSCIAFFLNLWALARLPAWTVGLVPLIIPVVALTVGIIFGGEHFTLREALGSASVVAGISIALLPKRTRVAHAIQKCEAPT